VEYKSVFPLESKKGRTCILISWPRISDIMLIALIADGDYTDDFGRFRPILRV